MIKQKNFSDFSVVAVFFFTCMETTYGICAYDLPHETELWNRRKMLWFFLWSTTSVFSCGFIWKSTARLFDFKVLFRRLFCDDNGLQSSFPFQPMNVFSSISRKMVKILDLSLTVWQSIQIKTCTLPPGAVRKSSKLIQSELKAVISMIYDFYKTL